ncbi:type IV pilin protein [Anaeromyxobacter oryzae]|uniref:Uncharacterized protein n=1 Tax=Anaeromyxobacter oryzae TaxID=2918170 RepID=A0ABN6MXE3_9BACT|nr:prepilin-type N-terminal cleavage/methylation domain-containing protein [Anaeromyxobacter oryzae]BDG04350.1 hypothetical protein AMOR_33460 [Anaeromyxobacter oryzae]
MTIRRLHRRPASRGFTLIELMIVVAIISILSSVAIPTFQRLTLRSKTAERSELMLRIHKAVSDYYVQHGSLLDKDGVELTGGPQPPTLDVVKRVPNWRDTGWADVFRSSEEIMGATYYSYSFVTHEPAGNKPADLIITATGDLDGDNVPSIKTMTYHRDGGMYRLFSEDPEPGAEDTDTF